MRTVKILWGRHGGGGAGREGNRKVIKVKVWVLFFFKHLKKIKKTKNFIYERARDCKPAFYSQCNVSVHPNKLIWGLHLILLAF